MEEEFIKKFNEEILILGNHHSYGMFTETFEDRGNELLAKSKEFLENNPTMSTSNKIKIKFWHGWIVGFLSGQKLSVLPANFVGVD